LRSSSVSWQQDYAGGGRSRGTTAGIVLGTVSILVAAVISTVYFGILDDPLPQIHRYPPQG
jgi:hypothetical protein